MASRKSVVANMRLEQEFSFCLGRISMFTTKKNELSSSGVYSV